MAKNGGVRPGSGRPPGAQNKATLTANEEKALNRQVIREFIKGHIPAIVRAQVDNSLGVPYLVLRHKDGSYSDATNEKQVKAVLAAGSTLLVENPDGTMRWATEADGERPARVYTRQPHQGSASMLLAYAADKPVEPVEVTGAEGGPLTVKWQE